MRLVDYDKMRRGVQLSARPGVAAELRPLVAHLSAALTAAGFTAVEAEPTTDPDRLVIALCSFAPAHRPQDVAEVLERLWEDHLRFGFWEAHTVLVEGNQVELLAATRAGERGPYVTLHVLAQKAAVPAQRAGSTRPSPARVS